MPDREIDRVQRQGPNGGIYVEGATLTATLADHTDANAGAKLIGADVTGYTVLSGDTVDAQLLAADGALAARPTSTVLADHTDANAGAKLIGADVTGYAVMSGDTVDAQLLAADGALAVRPSSLALSEHGAVIPGASLIGYDDTAAVARGGPTAGDNELQTAVDDIDAAFVGLDSGAVASALLLMAGMVNPADTVTIGGAVFEFREAGDNISDNGHIGVLRSMAPGVSRAALIASINGTVAVHPGILEAAPGVGLCPLINNTTVNVVADQVGASTVRVKSATTPGGAPVAANPNLIVEAALSGVGDTWDLGSPANLNTTGGNAAEALRLGAADLTITVAMLTFGLVRVSFPFNIEHFTFTARSAAGAILPVAGDSAAIADGTDVEITLTGGVAPALQAGDIVTIIALG